MRDPVKLHAAFRAGRGHKRDRIFGFLFRGASTTPNGRLHMLPPDGVRMREMYGWQDKINDSR
jgi:hypothetical protein